MARSVLDACTREKLALDRLRKGFVCLTTLRLPLSRYGFFFVSNYNSCPFFPLQHTSLSDATQKLTPDCVPCACLEPPHMPAVEVGHPLGASGSNLFCLFPNTYPKTIFASSAAFPTWETSPLKRTWCRPSSTTHRWCQGG